MSGTDQFKQNVKHMFELQDKMKEIAAATKVQRDPIKEQINVLQEEVKEFMQQSKVDVCTYQDDRLELQKVTRYGSLTKKSLKEGLLKHFNNDETRADIVFNAIIDHIGSKEQLILKRLKNRKRKAKNALPENDAKKSRDDDMDIEPPELGAESDSD